MVCGTMIAASNIDIGIKIKQEEAANDEEKIIGRFNGMRIIEKRDDGKEFNTETMQSHTDEFDAWVTQENADRRSKGRPLLTLEEAKAEDARRGEKLRQQLVIGAEQKIMRDMQNYPLNPIAGINIHELCELLMAEFGDDYSIFKINKVFESNLLQFSVKNRRSKFKFQVDATFGNQQNTSRRLSKLSDRADFTILTTSLKAILPAKGLYGEKHGFLNGNYIGFDGGWLLARWTQRQTFEFQGCMRLTLRRSSSNY